MSDRSSSAAPPATVRGGEAPSQGQPRREGSGDAPFDAVLVIGHGTREPAGLAEFQSLVERVARHQPGWEVSGCYLELAEPSIEAAVDRLAKQGYRRIRAIPLVLFSAGHAKRDIPQALADAQARHPGLAIDLCPALGCHPEIVELSSQRCQQALDLPAESSRLPVSSRETLLILVGRGGSDAEALADLYHLADLRRAAALAAGEPWGQVEVAFAAVAQPSLTAALDEAARSEFRRIVVQPHLLFAGKVLAQIHREVQRRRQGDSASHANGGQATAGRGAAAKRQWVVTEVLGPDARLVAAVIDRVSSTATSVARGAE